MKNEELKILVVEPKKKPYEKRIPNTLEDLQQEVGGRIEPVYLPTDEDICILCNEESITLHLPPNRAIYDDNGSIATILFGPFIVVSATGETFSSLTDEQLKKYEEYFHSPELFLPVGSKIYVIRI